jgi:glutathione S-transferase
MKLIIGNKRYSSWSLRPWLLMKQFEIPFEEILVPLDQPTTTNEILKYSPSAKVPALIHGDLTIWESLSIMEYLNEKYPEKQMWPKDRKLRAWARNISNEMHGGFNNMRNHLPHDLQKELSGFDYAPALKDIERVKEIWRQCLQASGGPLLFGEFSIADAMYAPVVNRFVSYGVSVTDECASYVKTLRSLPAHQLWIQAGVREDLQMPRYQ